MSDLFENDYFGLSSNEETLIKMARSHFGSLVGSEVDYYGADAGDNTFNIDGIVFKVLEDEDDGYRSYMGAINYTEKHTSIFFDSPIARVKIIKYDADNGGYGSLNQGYRLIDVCDGHTWLEFGTDNYDDYYPMFIFRHSPKEPR
tara:strand:- start:2706 stop:3140 length:435 start_codon:yes stop_codon:yes gene_type:complete